MSRVYYVTCAANDGTWTEFSLLNTVCTKVTLTVIRWHARHVIGRPQEYGR